MAARTDWLTNDKGDLLIDAATQDFVIGASDEQHVEDTIRACPGWWKEFPADGVGVQHYLNSAGQQQELEKNIRIQLIADGYQVLNPTATITTDGITINPDATRI